MVREIIFESHSTSEDNEKGIASGHLDPPLSAKGREQALALGNRYTGCLPDVVLCSDLKRSYETAKIAFPDISMIRDFRLREWNYGEYNGKSVEEVERLKLSHIRRPFPNGENLENAIDRVLRCIDEQLNKFPGKTIMIIGHRVVYYALEYRCKKHSLENILKTPWVWHPNRRYAAQQAI